MWPTLVSPSWFDKKDFTYEPRLRNSENDLDPPLLPIKRINYDRYNFYPFRQHLHFRAVWLFFINIIIKSHEENHIYMINYEWEKMISDQLLLSLLVKIAAILKIEWKKETWVQLCQREFLICYGRVSFNQAWPDYPLLGFHFHILFKHFCHLIVLTEVNKYTWRNRKLLLPFWVQCSRR